MHRFGLLLDSCLSLALISLQLLLLALFGTLSLVLSHIALEASGLRSIEAERR